MQSHEGILCRAWFKWDSGRGPHEAPDLWAVHASCMPKCPRPQKRKYRLESPCLDTLHSDFSKKYTHERVDLAGLHSIYHLLYSIQCLPHYCSKHPSHTMLSTAEPMTVVTCVDLQQVSICNGWGRASTHGIPGHVWCIEEADCWHSCRLTTMTSWKLRICALLWTCPANSMQGDVLEQRQSTSGDLTYTPGRKVGW